VDLAKTLYSIDLMNAAASEIGRLVSDDNSDDNVTGLATDGTNLYGARLCFFPECSEIVDSVEESRLLRRRLLRRRDHGCEQYGRYGDA